MSFGKKENRLKKILIRILRIFLLLIMILLALLFTINFPVANFNHSTSKNTYDSWMSETLDENQLIKDVAMLGAHDAFTSRMSIFSSVDELSAESIQTGFTGFLIKGFSYRQSKTQVSDVTELLDKGVRYFDIRLTYNKDKSMWMTSHTYFSTPFIDILNDISDFLGNHPGEFLVLDIQHVNGVDYFDLSTFNEIKTLFDESGVLDYAYSEDSNAIKDITYSEITSNGTKAGVVILSKYEETDPLFYSYQSGIRSAWANTDDQASLYTFINQEAADVSNHTTLTGNQVSGNLNAIDAMDGFRVMQGVLTMQMSGSGIVSALMDWSLIQRAQNLNSSLIARTEFISWMSVLPIVMVDAADTNKADFLDNIMQIIIEYNQNQ